MKPDEIPDEVVAAAKRADHEEGTRDGRSYHEVADHQVRRLIAGAVAVYENAITWNTSCLGCATLLDSCYAETARREQAEAEHAERLARLTREMDENVRAEYQRGVKAERERLALLAEEHHARYLVMHIGEDGCPSGSTEPFADLIREGLPDPERADG